MMKIVMGLAAAGFVLSQGGRSAGDGRQGSIHAAGDMQRI